MATGEPFIYRYYNTMFTHYTQVQCDRILLLHRGVDAGLSHQLTFQGVVGTLCVYIV